MKQWIARPILALGLIVGMFAVVGPLGADAASQTASVKHSQVTQTRAKSALRDLYINMLAGRASAAAYQKALTSFSTTYGVIPARVSTPSCPSVGSGLMMTTTPGLPACLGNRQWNKVALTQADELYCPANGKYCYCGPATGYSILQQLGHAHSTSGELLGQKLLASTKYLETDYWGNTPWSGRGGDHPMVESITMWLTGSYYNGYYEQDGLGMPIGAPDTSTFESDVRFDTDYGYSLTANTTEVWGGYHLAGHNTTDPKQHPIGHWLPIYGYYSYGAGFYYADPAHSVPANWGWTAPQYGADSAANFTGLVQARGIVW